MRGWQRVACAGWLVLSWVFAGPLWAQAGAMPTVELRATFPPGPAIRVPPNQAVYLRIGYSAPAPVHLWARPYFRGRPVEAGSSPSLQYSGDGETLGFFFLFKPGQVDEVRVTAGDGRPASTPEIARWPLPVAVEAGAPAPGPAPDWVAALRAQEHARAEQLRAQAAQVPPSAGSMALVSGFMLLVLGLAVAGIGWPLWALWRWRGGWRWLAAVPAAAVAFVLLRIVLDTARDPTSHNLWPFELVMVAGASLVAMLALALVRRLREAHLQ
ncbi:MAG: hypothetical protein ACK40R_02005 [Thermomonas sp.]